MRNYILQRIFCSTLALLFIVTSQFATFALVVSPFSEGIAENGVLLELNEEKVVAMRVDDGSLKGVFPRSHFNAFQRQLEGEGKLAAKLLTIGYFPDTIKLHSPLVQDVLKEYPEIKLDEAAGIDYFNKKMSDFFVEDGEDVHRLIPFPLYNVFVVWSKKLDQGKVDPAELLFWTLKPLVSRDTVYRYLEDQQPPVLPEEKALEILLKTTEEHQVYQTTEVKNYRIKLYGLIMLNRSTGRSLHDFAAEQNKIIDMPTLLERLEQD